MKKIIVVFVTIVLMAFVYGLYLYFNPTEKTINKETDIKINAINFINKFEENDTLAELNYKNKVVQISGKVSKIEKNESGINLIFDEKGKFIIICNIDSINFSNKIDSIYTIKGVYAGYSIIDDLFMIPAEIKLTQCILVNK